MLFAKNLKQKRFNKKLSHKFLNSFRILKSFDTQTYRLTLFSTYRIHSIFHVFLLKSYRRRENDSTVSNMFFSEIIDDQKKWEIEEILKKRIRKNTVFYQIKWIDYSDKYIEWIKEKNMKNALKLRQKFDVKTKTKRKRTTK